MPGVTVALTFRIFKGDEFLGEQTLSQPVIKVGKLSSSHLCLDDDTVSRMHAVVEVSRQDDINILDLGSTMGTIVNGHKVNKAKLQHGDVVQFGDTRVELAIAAGVAAAIDDGPTHIDTPAPPPLEVIASSARPAPSVSAPVSAAIGSGQVGYGMDIGDDVAAGSAVEVAAMLEDSVVHVKHCMNPRGGKVTTATLGMFAAGALAVAIGFFGFFQGVSNASFNNKAAHNWTEVHRKPLHDFRPRRISLAYDWMAFGGLGLGLVLMTFGSLRFRQEKLSPGYRIGAGPEVEFPTEDSPTRSFPLIAPEGDEFVFNFHESMEGAMISDGSTTPLSALREQGWAQPSPIAAGAYAVQIPREARFRVRSGKSTFMISSVAKPLRQPVPLFAGTDAQSLSYLGSVCGVVLLFLALITTIPPDTTTLSLDVVGGDRPLARFDFTPPEEPKQELDDNVPVDDGTEQPGGTGTKMALESGKMGNKDSIRQSGQYAMRRNREGDPQLARQQAMESARRSGLLGAFSAQPGGAFASITGTGDFSSGLDDRDVYGGLLGSEVGEMQGGWGYGVKGTGPGSGGTGWGTIGTGRYGTIGHGSGTGSGYGVGSGSGGGRRRNAHAPDPRLGPPTVAGDLDKNIIRRYIRKKLPQIKYCYEKQLVVSPKLAGTVTTQFTISGNGAVISVQASGISDRAVEGCVAAAVKSIQFPKPTGGGLVNVRYPFTFQPAGE